MSTETDVNNEPTMLPSSNSTDFRVQAAYLAYSEAWERNVDNLIRQELNQTLLALRQKGDFSSFYQKINQYRTTTPTRTRVTFKAQRKRAWRQSQAKKTRIARHKK